MKKHLVPLFAAILLVLLPVALYVGTYLALVEPDGFWGPSEVAFEERHFYSYGGRYSARFYWPLEQIDRKLRPRAWGSRELYFPYGPTEPAP